MCRCNCGFCEQYCGEPTVFFRSTKKTWTRCSTAKCWTIVYWYYSCAETGTCANIPWSVCIFDNLSVVSLGCSVFQYEAICIRNAVELAKTPWGYLQQDANLVKHDWNSPKPILRGEWSCCGASTHQFTQKRPVLTGGNFSAAWCSLSQEFLLGIGFVSTVQRYQDLRTAEHPELLLSY